MKADEWQIDWMELIHEAHLKPENKRRLRAKGLRASDGLRRLPNLPRKKAKKLSSK